MELRITDAEFKARINKTVGFLKENDLDALLVTGDEHRQGDVRYLSDFRPMLEYSAVIITKDGQAVLLTGPESYDWAVMESRVSNIKICKELQIPGEEYPNTKMFTIRKIFAEFGNIKKIAKANFDYAPYFLVGAIKEGLASCEFMESSEFMAKMRAKKSPMEIAIQKHAFQVTEKAINKGIELAVPGKKESDIAGEMAKICYQAGGASQLSHCFMVAGGKKSAAALSFVSDKNIIREGDNLILDIGFVYEGYFSDAAKTIIIGKTSNTEQIKALKTAKKAQAAALSAVRAGVKGKDVDYAARSIIKNDGFGKNCLYGVMHGIGLQHCEYPLCGPTTEMELEPGMVFSVDVGLFNFKWGGIREETGIVVTENGCTILK